ncbi:alpha/beta hydrolase family protein [Sinosporangium siamense]|uniref:Esterase n=1 Tax=Sinosporangium siamense TaxID=1367973 RepID=A0A919V4Y6_9ACTN|nr:lipase [Sinosporangium siamense]GII92415.1 esterase [Sinosporangium siamense]
MSFVRKSTDLTGGSGDSGYKRRVPAVSKAAGKIAGLAVLVSALSLPMAGAEAGSSVRAAADTEGPIKVSLPAPTGPYPIGTVALRLVDRSRPDPLVPAVPYRELMISLWYPATGGGQLAPHMAPMAAADWDRHSAPPMGITKGAVDWSATRTHARVGAPVEPRAGKLPVVLFGSGDGGPRTLGTGLVEDLASRGYLVVAVDHTYEADQVEFPGGRLVRALPLPAKLTPRVIAKLLTKHSRARLADMRYVLDQVTALAEGRSIGGKLPEGMLGAPDTSRMGMLGQSLGGSVAAQLTRDDPRVDAGVNLDGAYVGPVAKRGVARPFLQLAAETHTRDNEPSWKSFWRASTGWKRELRFKGAAHGSFTDLQPLLPQIAAKLPKVPLVDFVGTIDPGRSVAAQRAYVGAFFDLHLRGKPTPLFETPDTRFPEVSLIP